MLKWKLILEGIVHWKYHYSFILPAFIPLIAFLNTKDLASLQTIKII